MEFGHSATLEDNATILFLILLIWKKRFWHIQIHFMLWDTPIYNHYSWGMRKTAYFYVRNSDVEKIVLNVLW